jgi:hypothetical protein
MKSTSKSQQKFHPHPEAVELPSDRVLVTLEMNLEQFEKIEPKLDRLVLEMNLIAHVRVG